MSGPEAAGPGRKSPFQARSRSQPNPNETAAASVTGRTTNTSVKPPTSVFQLGRMRHLDLLALWHQAHPSGQEHDSLLAARMSKDRLAGTIADTNRAPRA